MIGAVVAKWIYNGYDNGTLEYDKFMTRAETIVMLDRALGVKVAVVYDKAGVYGPETGHETIIGDVLLAVSPQIAKEPVVKILAVEKGNGQLDPKSIQPIVTNKKVTLQEAIRKLQLNEL